MSNLGVNGKKISGIIYRGVKYGGDFSGQVKPSVKLIAQGTIPKTVTSSLNTSYTSGYKITYGYTTEQFQLYYFNDLVNPISHTINYKFLLYVYGEVREITTLSLIYDGNNLFHIEGSIDDSDVYSSTKIAPSDTQLMLVDETNTLLYSDATGVLTMSANTASVTTTFTNSTITQENELKEIEIDTPISLPYNLLIENKVNFDRRVVCSYQGATNVSPFVLSYELSLNS